MNRWLVRVSAFCVCLVSATEVYACAVCYGDPDSAMVKGAEAGILVLLGVIGTLLLSIIGMIVFWARRAKRLSETENALPFPATGRPLTSP